MNFVRKSLSVLLLVLSAVAVGAAPVQNEPKADASMTIIDGNVRFTVLTPQLIRMEWSEDGVFEDRATLTFVNRLMPTVPFKVSNNRSRIVIKTSAVTLTYNKKGCFAPDNLRAEFMLNGKKVVWHYGDKDSLNLMGTTRTLDKADGWNLNKKDPIEPGILSRGGWSVVDDSSRHVLTKTDSHWGEWVECRPSGNRQDLYLFAYGHDYRQALRDYVAVAGRIPLPPKYAFGYWWSRFWQYSDNELRDLVSQMRSMDIPLDVLIIDMDWHDTWGLRREKPAKDEYGERIGWTGYTWKEQLFPSPKNLMTWCHDNHIKTSLNLHPASGIQPYEKPYADFVKAYGWTETGKSVPFHIDEQKWADAYFDTVLAPMERDGVDFWWLDWQQWKQSKYTKGLSNTFWLNHTFIRHMEQSGNNRPILHHRWGGLGSHRYQVGFSGDTYISWETLGFLPWFTATASNVGYGYWGHDIGGHMNRKGERGKPTEPELYTRWLQYAVFTPIFKTHCTKDRSIERRVWQFPDHMFYMRDAIRLRYTLAPYIYNAARQTYDTGVSMCRPMYYYYPEQNEAYEAKEQYMFGDDLLITAITSPVDKVTGLASRKVWLPEGQWYDCATGEMIEGGTTITRNYTLAENPYYAKAGAIIPMNPSSVRNLQETCHTLVLTFIPGADGSLSLYEDDGISKEYADKYATTPIAKTTDGNTVRVVIAPRQGSYDNAPASRNYELRFPACYPPKSVKINGAPIAYARYAKAGEWTYDGYTLAPIVKTCDVACDKECVVELEFDEADMAAQPCLYGKQGIFNRLVVLTPEFKQDFAVNYDAYQMLPDEYLNVSQTPNFITEYPAEIGKWLDRYNQNIDKFIPVLIEKKCLSDNFIARLKAQLIDNKH